MKPVAFILASTDHGSMIVNRNDFHQLPSGGGTYGVGHQLLSYGCYDPGEVADVLEILRARRERCGNGVVALDCGANIGVHTIEMANFMTGWGQVIAAEAQERLYYALCGNIALANVFNAFAMNVAVGAADGRMIIPQPNYYKPSSFGSLELRRSPNNEYIGQSISYAARDGVEVQVLPIDSMKNIFRLDFIKIDVEGMELEVLVGAKHTIEQFRPHLLVEHLKTPRAELEKALTLLGYSFVEKGLNLLAEPIDWVQERS
jgi:FkbM family methyltransferase